MSYLLTANNISLIRDDNVILDNISLNIAGDDFITIIGPNGAGKTMLLKCLMGIIKPTKGSIDKQDDIAIGYVPQHLKPDYAMPISVRQFICLRNKKHSHRLERVAREVQLDGMLDKKLHHLSGGELQHALLGRALLQEPNLLVLDEPAQNLDISGQLRFYKLLEVIFKERNIPIIMVSHDLHMVMASTRKVVCLYGHICCSGAPSTVTQEPEFVKLFGQDMADIMSVYHHGHNHIHHHEADRCTS